MKNLVTTLFLGLFLTIGADQVYANDTNGRDTTSKRERRIRERKKEKEEKDSKISISERGTPNDKPRKGKEGANDPKEKPKTQGTRD